VTPAEKNCFGSPVTASDGIQETDSTDDETRVVTR